MCSESPVSRNGMCPAAIWCTGCRPHPQRGCRTGMDVLLRPDLPVNKRHVSRITLHMGTVRALWGDNPVETWRDHSHGSSFWSTFLPSYVSALTSALSTWLKIKTFCHPHCENPHLFLLWSCFLYDFEDLDHIISASPLQMVDPTFLACSQKTASPPPWVLWLPFSGFPLILLLLSLCYSLETGKAAVHSELKMWAHQRFIQHQTALHITPCSVPESPPDDTKF